MRVPTKPLRSRESPVTAFYRSMFEKDHANLLNREEDSTIKTMEMFRKLRGEIRKGTVQYFVERVLPPVRPEFDIDLIYQSLIESEHLIRSRDKKSHEWKLSRRSVRVIPCQTRFLRIVRAISNAAQKTTSIPARFELFEDSYGYFSLDGCPDTTVYLENPRMKCPGDVVESYWQSTAFTFHCKWSERDAMDVSSIP